MFFFTFIQSDILYADIQYNDKLLLQQQFEWNNSLIQDEADNLWYTVFITPRNICSGYLLASPPWGDSNKYPLHIFLGANEGKKAFYHLSYWYMLGFFVAADSF